MRVRAKELNKARKHKEELFKARKKEQAPAAPKKK